MKLSPTWRLAQISVALLILPWMAQAGVIYNDLSSFLSSVEPGYYLEDFQSLTGPGGLGSPLSFSGNGFSYEASATSGFYATQTPSGSGNYVLTTTDARDPILITFTSGNVTAVGGYFLITDISGDIQPGTVTLTFSDGTSMTLFNQDLSTFTGYTASGVTLTSLTVTPSSEGEIFNWATIDNLYVGQAAIPEPATVWLVLGGLGLAAFRKFRR